MVRSLVLPRTLKGRIKAGPAPIGAGLRGFVNGRGLLHGNAVDDAIKDLLNESFVKIYGSNWIQHLSPLNISQIQKVLKGAMYYYGLGYDPKNYSAFFRNLQKSFPEIQPLAITKVLAFISGIDKEKFPGDYALLKTGKVDPFAMNAQKQISSTERKEAIAYEIKDKLDRGAKAIASSAIDAAGTINSALPWYLKPSLLLPVAGVAALAYFMLQKKAMGAILRPSYKSNPVPEGRAQAKKLFEEFHERKPKKTKTIEAIDASELVQLGDALEIGYRSNKWTGKKENYLHSFGKGVKLMATADGKTLVISGGKMEVKNVGIIN
jgi:hypothetical protein